MPDFSFLDNIPSLVTRSVYLALTVLVALLVRAGIIYRIRSLAEDGRVSPTMAMRLCLATKWGVALITGLIVLQASGVFQQAWAVLSATLAALAVAFVALWSVLSNMTSAVLLLTYGPFRMGDVIELIDTNGTVVLKGKVVDLNLMFTTVHEEECATRIPNNIFLQKLVRVRREGRPPDPAEDASSPFFERPTLDEP